MINKLKPVILFLIIMTFVTNGFTQGGGIHKVGTTSLQFLKVSPDARTTAMGETGVSFLNSAGAVFSNPAGISSIPDFDVSVSYIDWLLDMSHTAVSAAKTFSGLGTFAIHGVMTNVGEIQETRVDHLYRDEETGIYNPGLTGNTFTPGSRVIGLSFSRYMTNHFTFGLTAKWAQEDLGIESASAIIFDGGVMYDTGFRSLQLAASIINFGPEIKYIDESYPLPQILTIGSSFYLLGPDNPMLFQTNQNQLMLAFNMVEARDYGQQYQVGLEYAFNNILFVRSGYKINYDIEGLTLGFGLNLANTRVDYSYNDFGEYFDSVHRFTVGFMR
ncbi:PorV/PorQ family protein [candidate division KSB1 bacterium]|nr:PorV/PorQ family protein [candidate division KSB1 bacterium]